METSEYTTIRITKKAKKTVDEFQRRTGTNFTEDFDLIMEQLQKVLDLQDATKQRLLWQVDFYNKDNVPKVIIRVSDALDSCFSEIPPELQKKVLEAWDYSNDGKFTDYREHPELRPKKESDVDPIQQQPHPPIEESEQK